MHEDNEYVTIPRSIKPKRPVAAIVIGTVIVIAGAVLVGVLLAKPPASAPPMVNNNQPASGLITNDVFTVTGSNFSFDVKEIRVKKGDTVKIVFKNAEGFHDWVVDEFNARTPQINAEAQAEVSFVADKTGTFVYYCSVGQHRAMGMVGNLIVE